MYRYIAVCFPFFRLRHNIKARFYIVPILLFAPIYNIPRFFEFETVNNIAFACLDDQLYSLNATNMIHSESLLHSKSYSSPILSAPEYLENTSATERLNKRDGNTKEYFVPNHFKEDISLGDNGQKLNILSILSPTPSQEIRRKRSNNKNVNEVWGDRINMLNIIF